ncbi:hypothetical protein [Streptomyces griseorubiginosus]|uniref:hypothetical protein n=1 Tax=Streptomyces griseorubiginosus TaxID=67304 RepID=UPI00331FF2F9
MSSLYHSSEQQHGSLDAPVSDPRRLTRVNVNLTPRSMDALAKVVALTHDRQTDAINRAIQVYSVIEEAITGEGAEIIIRAKDGQEERLRIV